MNIIINSVAVPADNRPVVNFSATDDLDTPLLKAEFSDARFILGVLTTPAGTTVQRYESYVTTGSGNANYDGARLNGVTEVADGTFDYKFATALPMGFDVTETHQIAGQFRRVFAADGETYRANAAEQFRPDGGTITNTRDFVTTESCNQCHTRLSEHGNIRREVQLCIMCHNHQTFDADTGNAVDLAILIHKIHMGEELPSVQDGEPYQIIGFGDRLHDYSTVVFPQDIRNCAVCHDDPAKSTKSNHHLNNPSIAGCGACHDRTWFGPDEDTPAGFEDHAIVPVTDAACSTCHMPGGVPGIEDKTDIALAHRTEEEVFGPGLNIEITNISVPQIGMTSDLNLVVDFMLTDRMGAPISMLDSSTMNILALTLAYPVPEYEMNVRETAFSAFGGPTGTLMNNGGGSYTYTFAETLPMGSPLTYAVAFEGRRPFMDDEMNSFNQGTSSNAQMLFTVDGSTPATRRDVVDEESCNVCHKEIRFHGNLRTGVNFCVMCHHPNGTDEAQRPGAELPPNTIHFKRMIHAVHTGHDLEDDFIVYGFGMNEHNFKEDIRFPGERQECHICHLEDTEILPLPDESLSTMIVQESGGPTLIEEILPIRSACTGCHNGALTELHTLLNTDLATGQETCIVCHGEGKEFDVHEVHELGP